MMFKKRATADALEFDDTLDHAIGSIIITVQMSMCGEMPCQTTILGTTRVEPRLDWKLLRIFEDFNHNI